LLFIIFHFFLITSRQQEENILQDTVLLKRRVQN
jgi:hypothetical protein